MGHLRRLAVILATLLVATISASCGDDVVTGERNVSPTPRPAATVGGRVVEDFAPGRDDRVAVVGVAAGETLTMRAQPGLDKPIISELAPTTEGLFGYGESFETDDGRLWWLVRDERAQGWIEPDGAAYLATPIDATATAPAAGFDSVDDLIGAVVAFYSGEPVVVDRSETGVTIDVLEASDADRGVRLVIEVAEEAGAVRVASVSEIALCRRGLTPDGGCA